MHFEYISSFNLILLDFQIQKTFKNGHFFYKKEVSSLKPSKNIFFYTIFLRKHSQKRFFYLFAYTFFSTFPDPID